MPLKQWREAERSFVMALAAIIKQEIFDNLSDDLKKEYNKQDNGMFMLDVAPVDDFALENVKGLKSALSSERTAREEADKKLKVYDGLDAEKAREALKKVEELASGKLDDKAKEQIEALKGQLGEKHQKEIDEKVQEIEKYKAAAINSTKGRAITDALAKHKGAPYLADTIEKSVKAEFDDKGSVILKVLDDNGVARISNASGSQDLMSIEEYVADMKGQDTYASAFEGSNASGSGAGGSGGTTIKNGVHVISQADSKDPAKYRAAKEAATKAGTTLQIADS